jgi:hypothetical protein
MKRFTVILLAISLAIVACNISFPSGVQGSGNIVTQFIDVGVFDHVGLTTIGNVYIEQGDTESLTIETDDNILPYLEAKVINDKLTLSSNDNVNLAPSTAITYHVTVKNLKTVITDSSGDFFVGPYTGDQLDIFVLASGNMNLTDTKVKNLSISSNGSGIVKVENMAAEKIQVKSQASGNVEVTGTTTSLQLEASGSGDVLAGDLRSSRAEIALQASGDITLWAVDTLNVTINGSGHVEYYGTPKLTQRVNTSGALRSLGEK